MKLSVIIPVYNEKNTVVEVIEKVRNVPLEKEIIVVDDGGTDGTRDRLSQIQKTQDFRMILKNKNEGKGSAIRTGLKEATGDVIIIQDADLECNPNEIATLFNAWSNNSPVVYGSRFLSKKNKLPLHSLFANKFLTWLTNFLFKGSITDMETCYKLISKDILLSLSLEQNGFEIEPEITCKILKKGYKIKEVPISYCPRNKDKGKKICWKDGIKAIFYIVGLRLKIKK
jgi:glycosyltransferase involved in cell wall biosynthesis